MQKAIGMIELKTVSAGMTAADAMVKAADVELLEAQTVCPGKYLALIKGELSAVDAAIKAARKLRPEEMIGDFILGNPHESIFPAIYGASHIAVTGALGILETYDAASIIVAADVAAKTAVVRLVELRIAKGMCGKSYLLLSGEVAACEASIAKAKEAIKSTGMFLASSVIAHPDEQIWKSVI